MLRNGAYVRVGANETTVTSLTFTTDSLLGNGLVKLIGDVSYAHNKDRTDCTGDGNQHGTPLTSCPWPLHEYYKQMYSHIFVHSMHSGAQTFQCMRGSATHAVL